MSLEGQIALVTGGAGDIGYAMARHLAEAGAQLVIWDLHAAKDVQAKLAVIPNVFYEQVDVRDRDAVDVAINTIVEKFGSLDIVCSNAGIVEATPFLELSPERWQKHLDVNLTGGFHVGQLAALKMVELGVQGRIIFTSSWVSQIPWPEITAYPVSKAGVNMLVKQMARELAIHGIRVNAIAPGILKAGIAGRQLVEEPQYAARVAKVIPLGEPGTPTEIAQAVVYLAGPQTAYMTGTILLLDGGCSLFQFDQ
jgi:NAD(P)-dependent dehydrogenase (short-subunit alcohol dehydrogenase family)